MPRFGASSIGAVLIAAAVLAPPQAFAAAVVPAEECRLEAWVIDRDPAGLNVRSAPSREARVLGTVPPLVNPDGERDYGVELRITGAKDGWLRVEGARDDPSRNGLGAPRPTYSGSGWISGNLVRFGVQSAHGYAQPDAASERRVDLGEHWLSDRAEITRVVACKDDWAHVEFRLRAKTGTTDDLGPAQKAWFRGICANQETTCDRSGVD